MSDELSDKIIERIDVEQIETIPRWRFIFWRGLFWLFAALSVIFGGLAVGAILFLLANDYLRGLLVISYGMTEFLLMIPYLWLVVFGLFILITHASIKHTKRGYQYRLYVVVLVSLVLSFILGSVFYFVGIGEITHEYLNKIPLYNYATYDVREALEHHQIYLKENSTSTRTNK
jgi:hypothetical protein